MTDGSAGGAGWYPHLDGWAVYGEVVIITAEAGLGHYGLTMTYWYWTTAALEELQEVSMEAGDLV
jgi:hypothetical protein